MVVLCISLYNTGSFRQFLALIFRSNNPRASGGAALKAYTKGVKRYASIKIDSYEAEKSEHGTHHIVESHAPPIEDDLSRKAGDHAKPKLNDVETNVLIEGVKDHLGDTVETPSPMDQKKFVEKSELRNGVV